MDIQHVHSLVHDDFEAVNTLILEKVESKINLITNLSNHIIQSGGKRLRPLLILLTARACQYQGDHHIYLAAAIEFFHTASLLHDDVVDESSLRRGHEAAHEIWGTKASILVGDFLFTQFMQLITEIGSLSIIKQLTNMAYEATCGELKQMNQRHNPDVSIAHYYDVIRAKTSIVFAASISASAILSQVDTKIISDLYQYGLHLGNAFQMIDDALDFCSDASTLGKNIGDDLADGKATLPLIYALETGTKTQQEVIISALKSGELKDLDEIKAIIQSTNAVDFTQKMAQIEVEKAISALQNLPDSVYKEALTQLAGYALKRHH